MIKRFYRKTVLSNKNNKIFYYVQAFWNELKPSVLLRKSLNFSDLDRLYKEDKSIRERVDYYNKLSTNEDLQHDSVSIGSYKIPKKIRVYYFDSKYYLKHFNPKFRFNLLPGDITILPPVPTIVKSRPIADDNHNSVILNLDKCRHFNFLIDILSFQDKKKMLIGRSGFGQAHRARFYELYSDHNMCDLKKATRKSDDGYVNIEGHLQYRYILALEGNDVATNLKWIMSSNSIAVMPKPKYETWFMEGMLIPDYHYICIKDDYSDLEEKLTYYNNNFDKAEQIINNAHSYINRFRNKKNEKVISLLVLKKYFERTNQM